MENDNVKLKDSHIVAQKRKNLLKSFLIWIKDNVDVLMFFATLLMAIFTYQMALETKELAELDLRPYVTPKDVGLEYVDKGGTPIKFKTQLGVEVFSHTRMSPKGEF